MNGSCRTAALFGTAMLAAGGAHAQSYTFNSVSTPTNYGIVAAGATGDTIFAQTGTTLTVVSGNGARISGTIRRATISIRCTNATAPNLCNNVANNARVKVGNFSTSGRAKPYTEFIATAGANTTLTGATTGSTLDFVMSGWTGNGTRTFTVDTKMPVIGDDVGGTTGTLTNTYYVYVDKNPIDPTIGGTVPGTIVVRKALRMEKLSDLRFGRLVKRTTGSGTVTIDQTADGTRTTGGTAPPYPVEGGSAEAAYGRAKFLITGEPSTTFSIAYSPTGNVVMNNQSGSGSLSITMMKTNTGNTTMPASGELTLGVGGRITVNSASVVRGYYEGSFTVTITYN